jgi:hypothetical protein
MDKPLAASTLNKVLAFGLAMTLVAWTFGSFFVLPVKALDGAHPNGVLVLSGSTVFKILDGQRLGFPSANVFLSHGYGWGQIVPANSADMALPQGQNVQFADGALVNDAGTVFVVTGGLKYGFTSATVFTGLGYKWTNIYNEALPSYTQGADLSSTTAAHGIGTLVNSNGTIYKITSSGRTGIPTLAVFNSWGFDFAKTVPANAADVALSSAANLGYRVGAVVNDNGTVWAITSASAKAGFPSASCFLDAGFQWAMLQVGDTTSYTAGSNLCSGSTPTTTSNGTLLVSLASDTPASSIVLKNSARAPFTKINLTATGGDVIVDNWAVKRVGVAQDSNFSSVDIVDLTTNAPINDTGKTFTSEHVANFTENLTIPNGTTKSVMLVGNMGTGNSGETPALALQSITLVGGSVSGNFPITGNSMTINTSIVIGSATMTWPGAYNNATSTLEVGKKDYAFFSFSLGAGSTEDVQFSQVKVYQAGSASLTTDLTNLKFYNDGTLLASGTNVGSSYINFTFSALTIPKGQTKQFVVKGDVSSGSARTIKLGLYRATDLLVKGLTYGANIAPTMSGSGTHASTNPVMQDNTFTISAGTLRVGQSSTVAAGNITVGSNQTLGAFEFEAKGEPVVISALTLNITSTSATTVGDALQAVKLVDKDGKTVAGPTDVTFPASTLKVAFSDTFTVPVGVGVYKVVATMATNGGWATNDTIYMSITPSSGITCKGDQTGLSITADPTSAINATTQTLKAAGLTVTKNSTPTNKSVIKNSQGVWAASWTFDATNAGEDVRITSLAIRASSTGTFNNLTLKDAGVALSPVNAAPSKSANTTSTFALSSPIVVTKGTSKVIDLYVDIGSNSVAGEVGSFGITASAAVTAYGVTTGNVATATVIASNGALLTVANAGSLTVSQDASAPSSRLVVAGTTGVTLSEVRLKATNEAVDITKLYVSVSPIGATTTGAEATSRALLKGAYPGTYAQVAKVYLKLDGVIVGSTAGYSLGQADTQINLNRGDLTVAEGTTGKKLSVVGDLVQIGTNQPGIANAGIQVGLLGKNHFTAYGNGSNGSVVPTYTDSTGTPVVLHKAVPSVVIATPTNKLGATSVLHEAKISAVGGSVGLYRLSYDVTSSTGVVLNNFYTRLASCGSCSGVSDGSQLSATKDISNDATTQYAGHQIVAATMDVNQSHGKYYLGIAAGATAVIDLYASATLTTSADTVSTALLGDAATSTPASNVGASAGGFTVMDKGNFVWSDLNLNDANTQAALDAMQWYNGYLVSGLGSTATSTPVTIGE